MTMTPDPARDMANQAALLPDAQATGQLGGGVGGKGGMTMCRNLRVLRRQKTCEIVVRNVVGEDLSEEDALTFTDALLKATEELDGWGGTWAFEDTEQLSYDTVSVRYA